MADEPKPIDYFNPHATPEPAESAAKAEAAPPSPVAAIPVEFDAELSRSIDHGGVTAVETALRAMKVPMFRVDGGGLAKRETVLYVKRADFERAALVAGRIFARRARVRAMNPKREPVGEENWGMGTIGGIGGIGRLGGFGGLGGYF